MLVIFLYACTQPSKAQPSLPAIIIINHSKVLARKHFAENWIHIDQLESFVTVLPSARPSDDAAGGFYTQEWKKKKNKPVVGIYELKKGNENVNCKSFSF